jgi:hypothetical protein
VALNCCRVVALVAWAPELPAWQVRGLGVGVGVGVEAHVGRVSSPVVWVTVLAARLVHGLGTGVCVDDVPVFATSC